jgi:hypothetical protein
VLRHRYTGAANSHAAHDVSLRITVQSLAWCVGTCRAVRETVRVYPIAFLVALTPSLDAIASPRSGGGSKGGGGRLAAVSSGIGKATGSGSGGSYRGSTVTTDRCSESCRERRTVAVVAPVTAGGLAIDDSAPPPSPDDGAHLEGYFGAQKVFESDGAISGELAVVDRRLRLAGTLTRYYERQSSGNTLTMTMPTLALGIRIDDSRTTRVYLEAGAAGALTRHDPVMDSSITGFVGGVHAEHSITQRTSLIGDARIMAFQDDVRAAALRAGVRYGLVQASFSVLDFNVGPALYGPEVGVRF